MGYHVVGRLFVVRNAPADGEEVGECEVLLTQGASDTLYNDDDTDLQDTIFQHTDVPEAPGVYAIMYAAYLAFHQDYWGDYDVDVNVEWFRATRLKDSEAATLLEELECPEELKAEDLTVNFELLSPPKPKVE